MNSKIQIVQQCYAEFGKGNPQGVLNLLTDDVAWIDPGYPEIPYAGKRKGKNEVRQFFGEMAKTVTFTNFEPKDFMCDGNNVIVSGFFTGKGNNTGKAFETEWVMIWRVEDDKIAHYQAYIDTYNIAAALAK